MRKRAIAVAASLTAALAGPTGGYGAAAAVEAAAPIEERVFVESAVDTDHDGRPDRIAIDIARPSGTAKVPVVFEHSPYRRGLKDTTFHNVNVDRLPQEDLLALHDASPKGPRITKAAPDLPGWYDDYFVPRGYAVVLGHSIGTGDSEGCPTSGDLQETRATTAVIDWLNGRVRGFYADGRPATATWSTGKVGMTGISYNGSLPNQAAATGVDGLKAIVPIAALSSYYDYYRANGLVVAPGGWQGEDADILAKAVVDRTGCADEIADLTSRQDRRTGDEGAFWQERDYVLRAGAVKAAVFVMHGHSDWNVKGKQYSRWWEALRQHNVPRKIWVHRGGHGPPSRSDYQSTVGRWFDYWLKGIDNGIMTEPAAEVQYADGTWRQYADWPDPAAREVTFNLGATSATAPGSLSTSPSTDGVRQAFTDQGRTTTGATLVAGPDTANAGRLVYRSTPLAQAVRLSGTPRVKLTGAVDNRNDANLTALLVDYGSSGTPTIVTRGWLDPQNRNGQSASERLVQGTEYEFRFDMQPKDHIFAAGRRIGLVVISTDYDFTLRPPAGGRLHLAPALSSLTVPVVGLAPDDGTVVFRDDLETDKGWQANPTGADTATSGRFERADPQATTYQNATYQQGTTPSGSNALVTGSIAGADAGTNDLDGGTTSIRSPEITLPAGGTYTLGFQHYLAHLNNATAADYLRIQVVTTTGATTVFTKSGAAANTAATWQNATANLTPYAGQTIRLLIEAADNEGGSLIEAAIDDITITRR